MGAVVLVAVVAGSWLAWSVASSGAAPAGGSSLSTEELATGGSVSAVGVGERTAVEAGGAASGTVAWFRGRVVGVDGAPLAGVVAEVQGVAASSERMDAYRAEHGEVEWRDPGKCITGADGRFEIGFVPPPPYRFLLALQREDLVGMRGSWDRIEPGQVKDLGDVTMPAGARVSGRLVDREGVAFASPSGRGVSLSIHRHDPSRGEIVGQAGVPARVAADGSFEIFERVLPGTWTVRLHGALPVSRDQTFEVEAPSTRLEIVVYRPDEPLGVAGLVVDEVGAPVAGAGIVALGLPRWGRSEARSDAEGRFILRLRPDAGDSETSFRLRFSRDGHLTTGLDDVHWGETDLRVVMPRSPVMEVLVLRAADRSPVEEYGLRVLTPGGAYFQERQVVGGWQHPGGITRVDHLESAGAKRLVVEPRAGSGLAMAEVRVDVDPAAPPRPTILLDASPERTIRVQDVEGQPVAGSRIELIDAAGGTVRAETPVTDFGSGRVNNTEVGTLLASGNTDATGIVVLEAPAHSPVTLRCTGDHPPVVHEQVLLDADGFVVTVGSGATVRIRFEPLEVLARWRVDAETYLESHGVFSASECLPAVHLWRSEAGRWESFPSGVGSRGGILIDESGTAVVQGVPPGEWRVRCRHSALPSSQADSSLSTVEHPSPLVLRNGETTDLVFDLSAYRLGSVVGRVRSAGEPAARATLVAQRELATRMDNGEPFVEQHRIQLDGDGHFRQDLPVGQYRCAVRLPAPAGAPASLLGVDVQASTGFTVHAGEETEVELSAELAHAAIRIVGADGEPVSGLRLFSGLTFPVLDRPIVPMPTDAEGRTTVWGTAGGYQLRCRIRSLQDDAAYGAYSDAVIARHGDTMSPEARAELAAAVLDLEPPITLSVGGGSEQVLRLPAAWDR